MVWIAAAMALAMASAICNAQATDPVENLIVTSIRVVVNNFPDPEGDIEKFGRSLIVLKEGDRFRETLLDESIRALRDSRRFDAIHVDSNEGDGRLGLLFRLTPYPLINRIRFQDVYPIPEETILRAMAVSVGDVFLTELLPQQREAVIQLYNEESFVAPTVHIRPEVDTVDGNYTLFVDVDKGPYYKLTALNFYGNDSISDSRLKHRMEIWRGPLDLGIASRFVERDLRRDLNTLTEYYRGKGFAQATIDREVRKNAAEASAFVEIHIDEGPLYRIEFSGNRGFSDRTLNTDLVFGTEGNVRGRGERRSLTNIRKRYRDAGYLEAKVHMESELHEAEGQPVRTVRFVIEEGPRTVVGDVRIMGHQSLTEDEISANILTRSPGWFYHGGFSPDRLENDIQAIELLYTRHGFLNPDVHSETRFNLGRYSVDVVFHIVEGVRTLVDDTVFSGMAAITPAQALDAVQLKPGVPFQEHMVRRDESALKALIAEKGHPHVRVVGAHVLSQDRSAASLTYRIDEGPFVRLGSIHYQGDLRTRHEVLDREWTLSPGDPFSPRQISESQRNIRNLEIFTSVGYRALGYNEKQDKVDMVVDLEERAPYVFEGRFGYESDRRLFIGAKLADRNLGGMNRQGWVSGEISEVGYRVESGLGNPRLLGSRVTAKAEGYVERHEGFNQDFGTNQAGVTVGLDLEQWDRVTFGLNGRYEHLDQFQTSSADSRGDILTEDQLDPRNVLVFSPKILYDSRDSFLRPRSGIFSLGFVDISKGIGSDLDNFLRYYLDVRYHWTPVKGLTFAFVGRGGYIDPYNESGRVPKDQLFYLGGITDVRGFRQNAMLTDADDNAVGGRESLYGSIEARIGFGSDWEVPIFSDAGWLGGIQDPTVEGQGRLTAGTGLRYITPIGPIGILYGYRLNRKPGESPGQFYFSFGYTF